MSTQARTMSVAWPFMVNADDSLRKTSDHRDLVRLSAHIQERMRARLAKIPGLTPEREAREWAALAIAIAIVSSRAAVRRT